MAGASLAALVLGQLPPVGFDTSPTAVQQAKAAGLVKVLGTAPQFWSAIPQIPQQETVAAGSVIAFKYSAAHDVYSFTTQAAWTACTLAQATRIGTANQGGGAPGEPANLFEGVATTAGATLYFACGVGQHCVSGQKVSVTVQAGAGGGGGGVVQPPIGGTPPPGGGIGIGGGLDTSLAALQQAKAAGRVLAIGTAPQMWSAIPSTPQRLTASVGTALQFKYNAAHDVWSLPTQAAWTTCSMQQGTQLAGQTQGGGLPTDAALSNLYEGVITSPGTLYFACGIAGHCLQGQKILVEVADTGGGVEVPPVGGVPPGSGIYDSLVECGMGGGGGFMVGWLLGILCIFIGHCFVKKCRDTDTAPSLPSGGGPWVPTLDPTSGQTYFYNKATGETRWDRP